MQHITCPDRPLRADARRRGVLALVLAAWLGGALAAEPAAGADKLAINGPYYRKLVQMKDLVADILPPPAYIIESYLTVLRLVDQTEMAMADGAIDANEMKAIDGLLDYGMKLEKGSPGAFPGYFERIEVWNKELPEATSDDKLIKKLLVTKSVEPATKFFAARDAKFAPLVKAGDVAGAKALARGELKQLYLEHRNAIDAVVSRSRRINARIEKDVAEAAAGAPGVDTRIKGVLYGRIIKLKDLVADILPPPAYIIESYLTALQQIDETEIAMADGAIDAKEKVILDGLVAYARELESGDSSKGEMAGYRERIAAWIADLPVDTADDVRIKDLMTKSSVAPANAFFTVRDGAFTAALAKGDVDGAKRIARGELLPRYEEHRAQIDALVVAANAMYERVQAEVDALLAAH